ncbi:hypothetical protein M5D96_009608, partial [Drosophila gunungcola]
MGHMTPSCFEDFKQNEKYVISDGRPALTTLTESLNELTATPAVAESSAKAYKLTKGRRWVADKGAEREKERTASTYQ